MNRSKIAPVTVLASNPIDIRDQILISSELVVRSSWQLGTKAHEQSE